MNASVLIEAKETIFVEKMCENLEGSLNYPSWLYVNGYGPLQCAPRSAVVGR